MTIDHDNLPASIEALHEEAEELASLARLTEDPEQAKKYRADAQRKVKVAAQLRAQSEAAA